jgi:hypothetical protein
MKTIFSLVLTTVALLIAAAPVVADPSLGLSVDIVTPTVEQGSFPLLRDKQAATIYLDNGDYPGVLRAAGDLQADVERVSGVKPELAISAP